MTFHRALSLVAAAVLAAGATGAQTRTADVEVIVTASRVEESAEDAPASVSVITAEDLAAAGQPTLIDALERLAGVHFRSTTGGPAQAEVSMGGFGENSHGRVLVLVDGRRVNRPDLAAPNLLQVPVENVERVEVVRGPATVLYGDHAVAGVINIITKKGTDRLTVTASGMGGSYLLNQERLGVSGSAGPVRFALSGERTASDGYRDRSAWSSLGGGASLDAEISDSLAGSLRLGYNQSEYELPGTLSKAQWEADPTQAINPDDEARDRTLTADAGLKADLGDALELRAHVTWSWNGVETDFPSYWTPTYTDLSIHTVGVTPAATLTFDAGAVPVRVTGGVDVQLHILGLERFADEGRDTRTADVEVRKVSGGAYASVAATARDRLTLEAGGRYELARFAAEAGMGSTLDDEKMHQGIAATVSALYRVSEAVQVYAKGDRVYRYPFVDEQVVYSGFGPDTFLGDLEPETGLGAETGVRTRVGETLRMSGNFRILDMSDEIAYYDPDGFLGPIPGANTNLDETRHLGAAVDATVTAGPCTLSANYTWQLTTFRSGVSEGNEVPLVPNHEAFAEARLKLPLEIEVAANGRYVSESFQGGDNGNAADKVPEYVVVGASLTWKPGSVPGDLELFAGVENLLDEEYASFVQFDSYYPAAGRSWRVGGFYRY